MFNRRDMDLPARYSRPILIGTTVVVAINLGSTLWIETAAFPPGICFYAWALTFLPLLVLFFLHGGWAILWKGQRKSHLVMTIMVATAICGLAWFPMVFGNGQDRWFFDTGEREFNRTIDAIITNRSMLTGKHQRLDDVDPRFQVWGETNTDGTFSVFFYDQTAPRGPHGYLYYSGEWKESAGGSGLFFLPNSYKAFSHFTNHWYRF